MKPRKAALKRETGETGIEVELDLDGSGRYEIDTGLKMLDHLLAQIARHGLFDLRIKARGDLALDEHHTVEDVAITLGRALAQALGERQGIARMGHAIVPLDEALAQVAVDLSGRGYAVVEASFTDKRLGELPSDLIRHFLESFALEGRLNLHARLLAGSNDHHKAEALFKALAKALKDATRPEERLKGQVPSTKGVIEG